MAVDCPSRKTSELKLILKSLFLVLVLLHILVSTDAVPVTHLRSGRLEKRINQIYPLAKLIAVANWNFNHLEKLDLLSINLPNSKKRSRRELRSSRKMLPSPMPIQMPAAYFPFIMAEMLPGSVKTRHPAIIAVNGCPAYYIADTTGQCRQMFQYTANYAQRNSKASSFSYFRPRDIFWTPKRIESFKTSPRNGISFHNNKVETPEAQTESRNLSTLFINVDSKNVENDEIKSNSGESTAFSKINKIREKILSLLKLKNKRDSHYFKNSHEVLTTASPPDYDE